MFFTHDFYTTHCFFKEFVNDYDYFIDRQDDGFDSELAGRVHELRGHDYCWCDKDAVMQYNVVSFRDIFS